MKKKAIKYLRKKGILRKHETDLNMGLKGGNIQSLTELLTEFAEKQVNGVKTSHNKALHKHFVMGQIEQLINFLIHLNDKGLINNHDFDYEKEAKKYIKKIINCP